LSTGKLENIRPYLGRVELSRRSAQRREVREGGRRDRRSFTGDPRRSASVREPIPSHLAGDHLTLQVLGARHAGVKRLVYAGRHPRMA
jgi:hypothetical protein